MAMHEKASEPTKRELRRLMNKYGYDEVELGIVNEMTEGEALQAIKQIKFETKL